MGRRKCAAALLTASAMTMGVAAFGEAPAARPEQPAALWIRLPSTLETRDATCVRLPSPPAERNPLETLLPQLGEPVRATDPTAVDAPSEATGQPTAVSYVPESADEKPTRVPDVLSLPRGWDSKKPVKGCVASIDRKTHAVALQFRLAERQDLPVGGVVRVYHQFLLGTEEVGTLRLVRAHRGLFIAAPSANLPLDKITRGDLAVFDGKPLYLTSEPPVPVAPVFATDEE
jgi:hypothetical protein